MSVRFNTIRDFILAFKNNDFRSVILNGKILLNNPNFKEKKQLHNIVGLSLFYQSNYQEAILEFKKSIDLDQNNFEAFLNLGSSYLKITDLNNAELFLKKAIDLDNKNAQAHILYSKIFLAQNKIEDSISYLKSLKQLEKKVQIIFEIGRIYISIYEYENALSYFNKANKINPNNASILNNLGICYDNLNKNQLALDCFLEGFKINKNDLSIIVNLANTYRSIGDFDNARAFYNLAISKKTNLYEVHRQISTITSYKEKKDLHLLKMIDLDKKNNDEKGELLFAISKAYEDLGEFDISGEYLVRANNSIKKKIKYNIDHSIKQFENIKSIFNQATFNPLNIEIKKKPIFILGMPRSGTTLVEQIVGSHKEVFATGELYFFQKQIKKFFPDSDNDKFKKSILEKFDLFKEDIAKGYLECVSRMTNENIFTDKLPFNFIFIGFIKSCFPQSKIIHVTRDARDNCYSIYKNFFPLKEIGFVYDQKDLANYYNAYSDLMNFWKKLYPDIYDIKYENLISDQYSESKKLIKYIGLEWDENCLEFYKNKSTVKTLSTSQVRKKITSSSINSWKRYEKYLSELITNLKN